MDTTQGSFDGAQRYAATPEPTGTRWDVLVRPVRAGDLDALVELHRRLSPLTLRSRFLTRNPDLSRERLAELTDVNGRDRVTYVAVGDTAGRLTGVGRYVRRGTGDDADVTLVADDDGRDQGVDLLLLERLVGDARRNRLDSLLVHVLPLDRTLIDELKASRFRPTSRLHCGVVTLTIRLRPVA